jgi:Mg2+ and Co2+ transporter CorA
VLGTILLVFGMKYLSAIRQSRTRAISEDAYRDLAQKAAAAQSENAGLLSSIQTELTQLNARLAAVEKILKAVE